MKQKAIFIVSAVLLILVFLAGAFVFNQQRAEQAEKAIAERRETLVRFHSPSLGPADAPVHIVEFFDPACGTCREFYPLVKEMMAANRGKIRLTVRYAPFHNGSDQVVAMLEAARKQGKYWQAVEALLATQRAWVINHAARPEIAWSQLGNLGLDMARLKEDMGSQEIARAIAQDVADARALNVTKTPEFFVNARPLPSFGYQQLKTLVDEALQGAKAG